MEKTVGIAELTSITYGIAASDAMLKAGQVRMLRSAPMCPGKYLIVIGGDTGEVKAAMEAGAELAGKHLRNSYVIPHIHEQVLDALSKKSKVEPREAAGQLQVRDADIDQHCLIRKDPHQILRKKYASHKCHD